MSVFVTANQPGFFGTFWDLIWTLIVIFAFVVYIMAMFSVIGDLFRDAKLGGGAKAIWMIFLILIPFLTLLVYLIARGDGMAERGAAETRQLQQAQDSYIRSVAGSPAHDIAKAKELLDAGTISQQEYEALKARALSS